MNLRWAGEGDYDALGQVMFDAVRSGRSLYSEAQRRAWVAAPRAGAAWRERLAAQQVVLAEADDVVQGFMSLSPDGYIDFAYIRPPFQRTGLFRRLFTAVQDKASELAIPALWTHASLMAQPAFAAVGFVVIQRETVALGGETFDRFKMEKPLTD